MSTIIGIEEEMLAFPYNSEENADGDYDRAYDSQDFADYFARFIGNGIYPNPSDGLRILSLHGAGSGDAAYVLTVKAGSAFINGRCYIQRRDFQFPVTKAHLTLGRRDIVVVRHDIIARSMQLHYIEGTPSAIPQIPSMQRTDDIFDLKLCEITVNPNAQLITQANVLDTRLNNAACGIVTGVITQADTTAIFNQYDQYLKEQISLWSNIRHTQEEDWETQLGRQEFDWRKQTTEQRNVFAGQTDEFNKTLSDMYLMLGALETQTFATINNNFDDWSVRKGCDRRTTFGTGGTITETINVVSLNFEMAKRVTEFAQNGTITETVTFNPWESGGRTEAYTVVKRTIFETNGSIREEIR